MKLSKYVIWWCGENTLMRKIEGARDTWLQAQAPWPQSKVPERQSWVQTLWRHSGARSPTAMGAEGWGAPSVKPRASLGPWAGVCVKITANLKLICSINIVFLLGKIDGENESAKMET